MRKSLERALRDLGSNVRTATSDADFNRLDLHQFDVIVLDPWTWAAKGNRPDLLD